MSEKRKAIILGGGPAGIATALRLQQKADISCSVYELRPEPTTLGSAIGILPNGLRLLDRLGLLDQLLSRGSSRSEFTMRSIQGSILAQNDFVGWARQRTGYGYMRIKRAELLDTLLEAADKARIPVYYNKRITAIEENENGVTARFSDGTSDSGDLLLGCDGIHSQVRKLYVDPSLAPEYSGFAGLASLIPASAVSESTSSQIRGMNVTLTQDGMFMAMTCTASDDELLWGFSTEIPLPSSGDSRDGWEANRKEEVDAFKSSTLKRLENAKGEWANAMREVINNSSVIQFYPVYRLPLGGTWHKGRVILLGDAAHAMQPHAGQGVSMALEDAFLLSRLLEDRSRSLDDVYERFDEMRRPRVDMIANLAKRNAQVRKKVGPWGLWFKELAIWAYVSISNPLGLDNVLASQKHLLYDVDEDTL